MLILTTENTTLDLDLVGRDIGDTRYSVFDISKKDACDYYFKPLVFLDLFDSAGAEFDVGGHKIIIPKDWSVVVADQETGDVELIVWDEFVGRKNLTAFGFNPISGGFYPDFLPIQMTDIYPDVSWSMPRLENHNFLTVPIQSTDNPKCILIINEQNQKKIPDILTLGLFLGS